MIRFLRNIFIFLIILFAAIWAIFQSETIREKAAVKLEEIVFDATGMHIEMDRMTFSLPRTLTAYNFKVRDKTNQLLLEADRADFTVALRPLFKGQMPDVAIDVNHAKLYALPNPFPTSDENNSNNPEIALSVKDLVIAPEIFQAIDLPSTIKLETLNLNNILFFSSTQELSGEGYIEGFFENKPVNLQATFQRKTDKQIQANFKAIYDASLPVNGTLYFSPEGLLDGSTFHIPLIDIASIEQVKDLEGLVQIDGALLGTTQEPLIDFEVHSPELTFNGTPFQNLFAHFIGTASEKKSIGQITLSSVINGKELLFNTDFRWMFDETITMSSSELLFDDLVLTDLKLEGVLQNPEIAPFRITGEGIFRESPIAFEAKGQWENENNKLAINALNATLIDHTATGWLVYAPNEISGAIEVSNIALSSLPVQWISKPAEGKVSLKANLSGSPNDPHVKIALVAHELQVDDEPFSKIKKCRCDLMATIEKGSFSTQGTLTTSDLPPIKFQMQLPLTFSINPWVFEVQQETPLRGHLTAQGELSKILHQLMDNPLALSGNVQIALNLGGTLQQPKCTGNINIVNGIYEIPEIGVLLKDLHGMIEVQGQRLVIKEIAALDGTSGRVFGRGYFEVNREQENPFLLELTLQEAALMNQDKIKLICNGPLTFKGNNKEGLVSGKLEVSDGTVTIPERSYSTINTVDVTFVNVPIADQKSQCTAAKKNPWPLSLDIHLNIPRSMSIEGKDLTSSWKGEVAVQGKASAPQLFGELRISEGQYLFNGNPFALNQGTINFAGDFEKKTTLYVIAEKDLDKVKIDVIVKGPVKNPAISFRSNPPMPQREILSWLLFNRGTSQISPFQGAQLSESITNLTANQQGPDVLSKIRSTFKIDRFEIGRNPNVDYTGVNLEVGKYISDNILISVIKSDVNKIAIEANLTNRIKLQGQVGDDSQGKLLLKWKRDY